MAIQQEFKENVFRVIEEQMSLKDFESWLYSNEALSDQMTQDVILEAYSFNYGQKGARYEFRNTFLEYFDKEEFMLWKLKSNLQDLVEGKPTRDRILNDFYWMGYDELPCLQGLRYYMYHLEDAEYLNIGKESVIKNLKKDANDLLQEIIKEEIGNPDFRIFAFKKEPRLVFSAEVTNTFNQKEWWKFWK